MIFFTENDDTKEKDEFDFVTSDPNNTERSILRDAFIKTAFTDQPKEDSEPAGMLETLSKGGVSHVESVKGGKKVEINSWEQFRAHYKDKIPSLPQSRHLISLTRFKTNVNLKAMSANDAIVVKPCEVKVRLKKCPSGEVVYKSLDPQVSGLGTKWLHHRPDCPRECHR
jgi:hypothetical protein